VIRPYQPQQELTAPRQAGLLRAGFPQG